MRLFLCLMIYICLEHVGSAKKFRESESDMYTDEVEYFHHYRVVNWCVSGRYEDAFFKWPLIQFKPFLMRTEKWRSFEDAENEVEGVTSPAYTLEFRQLSCEGASEYFGNTSLNQRAHVIFKSSKHIEGLIIQGVHAPFGMGFPFGQFDNSGEFSETPCSCAKDFMDIIPCLTRPDLALIHPTIAAFHFKQRVDQEESEENPSTEDYQPENNTMSFKEHSPQTELHMNFKWHHSECSSAQIVEFWALIVHSFTGNQFEIYKFGPYNFQGPQSTENGEYKIPTGMPTPIIPPCRIINATRGSGTGTGTLAESPIKCDGTPKYEFGNEQGSKGGEYDGDMEKVSRPRFEGLFDSLCISQYDRKEPGKQCANWTGRFLCTHEREIDLNSPVLHEDDREERLFPESFCQPCATIPPEGDSSGFVLIKMDVHGCLLTFVFFVLVPLLICIGRYYKEVLHYKKTKGWRIWLWIHFVFAHLAMVVGYSAYVIITYERFEHYQHMDLGTAAVILFGLAMISGWGRHRQWCLFQTMFWAHVLLGYSAWGLGVGAFFTTRTITSLCRFLAYVSFAVSLGVEVILTIWICGLDRKLGVEPPRKHIPVVMVRFDSNYLPHQCARMTFLYIYIIILLGLYGCLLVF